VVSQPCCHFTFRIRGYKYPPLVLRIDFQAEAFKPLFLHRSLGGLLGLTEQTWPPGCSLPNKKNGLR
jgi:hypothetical protein